MERIKKVTQKEMCKIAKNLNAKRIGSCCYQYESVVSSKRKLIDTLALDNLAIDNFGYDNGYIHKQQLYYSCGMVYGQWSMRLANIRFVCSFTEWTKTPCRKYAMCAKMWRKVSS